jgi:rod shape-determining protein MreC
MDTFLGRYKNLIVLAVVLLAQILFLAVQVRRPVQAEAESAHDGRTVSVLRYWVTSLTAPPAHLLQSITHGSGWIWSSYLDLVHTKQQNAQLQHDIDRLRYEQAAMLEDARQGQRLQHLLDFQKTYIAKTIAAQVIETSGSERSRVVYLDKGSANGLKPDMPVVLPGGIVGKIRESWPHRAQVLLVNDQTSGAGVLLETTRIRGILRGNLMGQLLVVNLLADDRIKPGEKVLTSGGDGVFPAGLPVGIVEKIQRDPERDSFIQLVVKPYASLMQLDEVLVITETSSRMTQQQLDDVARSEAEKGPSVAADKAAQAAEAERKRASDLLSERLPSVNEPNTPTDPNAPRDTGGVPTAPLKVAPSAHPDRFTYGALPPVAGTTATPGTMQVPTEKTKTVGSATKPASKAATPKTIVPRPLTAKPAAPKSAPNGGTN